MTEEHVKFFVSSKAVILETRVEEELKRLREAGYYIDEISSDISFAGEKGYMILVQVNYHEVIYE